jgi:diacylglycerol kinase (ATP)
MTKTLIILNPHAASGNAGKIWTQIEPLLWEKLGELVVAITQRPEDVAQHLDKARASGLTRVISIGGDGTNHALINALADLNAREPDGTPMVYGNLPVGTGRDWARGTGIPYDDVEAAARWIAEATPRPTDIGLLVNGEQREHFLNVASAGISGEIAARVNSNPIRRSWTYLQTTIATLLEHKPQSMQITLDGQAWYDGPAYIVAIANGSSFGRGMKIAPQAQVRDGLFDVILVEGMSRPRVLAALQQVYSGSHLTHPRVRSGRAAKVQVASEGKMISVELDGETTAGRDLTFQIRPGLLHLLA